VVFEGRASVVNAFEAARSPIEGACNRSRRSRSAARSWVTTAAASAEWAGGALPACSARPGIAKIALSALASCREIAPSAALTGCAAITGCARLPSGVELACARFIKGDREKSAWGPALTRLGAPKAQLSRRPHHPDRSRRQSEIARLT